MLGHKRLAKLKELGAQALDGMRNYKTNVQYFSNILYMAPVNSYVSNMHRVPTYEELVYEAIIHPTDKIKLPDRQATFIRNLPQMTRFDDVDDPADIGKEQELIEEEQMKEITLRKLAAGKTIALERARTTQRPVTSDYLRRGGPGGQPPPSAAGPRAQLALATEYPRRKGMLERAGDLVNWGLDSVISYEQRQAEIAEAEDTERQLGFVFGQAQEEE
jgi:hypothetical protein